MTDTVRPVNFPGNRKNKVLDIVCRECHVIIKNVETWVNFPNAERRAGVEIQVIPKSGKDTPVAVDLKSLTHMVFSPKVIEEVKDGKAEA